MNFKLWKTKKLNSHLLWNEAKMKRLKENGPVDSRVMVQRSSNDLFVILSQIL